MAALKRGATGTPAAAGPALAGVALMTVALTAVALGGGAHAFTFEWVGHHDAHADASPAERRFSFPWAAHVDIMNGDYAAKQFVQNRLPAGLPMAEAVARAEAARSNCGRWRVTSGPIVCRYEISAATDGAALGQEVWTLTLTPGPDGKLASAAVDRTRVGIPGDLGARAIFHFEFGD